jgi:glycosyltransferase involved in cell wall biosynthesis
MTISIAMCTYNGGRFLDEQLNSISSQTRLPDELVVCDDGSSDNTCLTLEAFAASAPFPVRITKNPRNLGSTANFEQAVNLCTGELIALCDQDDIWSEGKLAALEARFTDSSIGGVFSDGGLIDDMSRSIGGTLWGAFGFTPRLREQWRVEGAAPVLMKQDIVTGATLMFRASLRPSIVPIAPEWIHDGWISWIVAMTLQLDYVEEPLIRYRVHGLQQAGVPDSTLRARCARLLSAESSKPMDEVAKFDALRDRFSRIATTPSSTTERLLAQKLEHCRFRAQLPESRTFRLPEVLTHLQDYRQYSRGFTDAVKDLVQP